MFPKAMPLFSKPQTKKKKKRIFGFFESNKDDFGEFHPIFIILQVMGLAPYNIGKDEEHSTRSNFLTVYNILIATCVMVNMYQSKKDPANDLNYPNKTFLVDVAYNFVDILGNFYVFFVTIKSVIHTDVGITVWFKLKSIGTRLQELNVVFDYRKMKYYMFFKIALLLFLSVCFLASDVLIRFSMGLYYTGNYWFASLFPLLFSVIVGIIFGSCTLCLFQRLWVINEFLRRYIEDYDEIMEERYCKKLPGNKLYNERILENVIFQKREVLPKKKKKKPEVPLLLMMKNYEECFSHKIDPDVVKAVKNLKEIHYRLFELTNDLNSLFGTHFIFIFVTYFFGITINLYFAITFHLRSFQSEQYASACLWSLVYLFLITYLILYSNIACNEARRTVELVHLFLSKINLNDYKLQFELHSFSHQLLQCPIKFRANGFFALDSALLFQFIAGVMSNVVFVVQFDKINFSEL